MVLVRGTMCIGGPPHLGKIEVRWSSFLQLCESGEDGIGSGRVCS